MPEIINQVFYPSSTNELCNDWNKVPDAIIFGGGVSRLKKQTDRLFLLPKALLSMDNIGELRKIDRTERYLEIGSMVNLNRIALLGKIVPEALSLSLKSTGTFLLRNLMTVGSCICKRSTTEPLIASLVALDSRYEFKTENSSRWISASYFSTVPDKEDIFHFHEYLARIRIPLEIWHYTHCRDFSTKESGDSGNEFAVFLARMQKDILCELRLIFSGTSILRDRESELTLIGKKLPLDKKTISNFIEIWEERLGTIKDRSEFQKAKLLNFIDSAIHYFAY
ncbi:MAG: FAD binding domain-containing protein [Spirochaetaceae bacterium]|jgi:CO/xanthine dehydrogenase FAD-binding subunit|nr:FAD binding domain-containing protein [Spirochaetaceae bacterium]